MRLDYALYGLAVILFAVSVVSFLVVKEQDGQLIYVISTAAVGLLSLGTGLVSRPKAHATAVVAPASPVPTMAVAEPIQTPAPVVEAPVAEPAKTEDPIPEAPQVQVEPPIEEPKVEAPTTIEPPPAPEAPQPAPAQVTAPPAPEPAPQVSSVIPPELVKIRGINPKRAEQLKAIGVGTIADLAKASPDELAAKLGVSPKIIKMWIGSAKKLVK